MRNTQSSKSKLERRIVAVLIALSLISTLNGCATAPLTVTKTELQRVPAALLSPCPLSELEDQTYEGAILLAEKRAADVRECNKHLDDIAKWSAGS